MSGPEHGHCKGVRNEDSRMKPRSCVFVFSKEQEWTCTVGF
jgi:hypothetical protein